MKPIFFGLMLLSSPTFAQSTTTAKTEVYHLELTRPKSCTIDEACMDRAVKGYAAAGYYNTAYRTAKEECTSNCLEKLTIWLVLRPDGSLSWRDGKTSKEEVEFLERRPSAVGEGLTAAYNNMDSDELSKLADATVCKVDGQLARREDIPFALRMIFQKAARDCENIFKLKPEAK